VLDPLPETFADTRAAMHALAEHVIAPARYRAEGRIGLIPTPGGFGTPTFGEGERVRVEGVELIHDRPGTTTRIGITTLHDAIHCVKIGMRPFLKKNTNLLAAAGPVAKCFELKKGTHTAKM
jgi:hypothetical protein